jgi:tetratricopeptide (TPR) repeat protein
MQPDFPQGLLHLGNSLTGLGRYEEAVAVLRKSAEGWGDSGMPRYMLAHARAASGDMESAQKILDKMLETAERKYIKPYYIAMCYMAGRRLRLGVSVVRTRGGGRQRVDDLVRDRAEARPAPERSALPEDPAGDEQSRWPTCSGPAI